MPDRSSTRFRAHSSCGQRVRYFAIGAPVSAAPRMRSVALCDTASTGSGQLARSRAELEVVVFSEEQIVPWEFVEEELPETD